MNPAPLDDDDTIGLSAVVLGLLAFGALWSALCIACGAVLFGGPCGGTLL